MTPRPPHRSARAILATPAAGLVLLGLGACSTLPSSGPDTPGVVRAATGDQPAFKIVDLDSADLASLALLQPNASLAGIASVSTPGSADQIEVGDTLQIEVYEVGVSLFEGATSHGAGGGATAAGSAPGAGGEPLPPVKVRPNGTVSLPYIGRIRAAGSTPEELASAIQTSLRGKSESPQVMVQVSEDVGNTVIMMGDVRGPGRRTLSYGRERLLDMIAIAGGPANDSTDTEVRVTRGKSSAEMTLSEIVSGSSDDIVLAPGDRVQLLYRPPSFTGFGAAGKVSEVPFHSVHLSLAEALARLGGPSDPQADPTGVFIFRAGQSPDQTPVVYRLNLKNPKSFFIAQSFQVRDKDLIYVANAQANAFEKFMVIISTIVSPVTTFKYLGS